MKPSKQLFIPNLEFEFNLAGLMVPARAQNLLDELRDNLRVFAAPDGNFLSIHRDPMPGPIQDLMDFPTIVSRQNRGHRAQPWGWDNSIIVDPTLKVDSSPTGPSLDVVKAVNGKDFSHAIEETLGLKLPGCALVSDVAQAINLLKTGPYPGGWVFKSLLGVSAQGRLLGRNVELKAGERHWLEKQLQFGSLLLEPWFERVKDYSLQLCVDRDGTVQILGSTTLINNKAGRYSGNLIGLGAVPPAIQEQLNSVGKEVGERLFEAGYFGPAGIDAFEYKDTTGRTHLRPLVEINARQTFGALALTFTPLLEGKQQAIWSIKAQNRPPDRPAYTQERRSGYLYTCPLTLGGKARSRLGVLELL